MRGLPLALAVSLSFGVPCLATAQEGGDALPPPTPPPVPTELRSEEPPAEDAPLAYPPQLEGDVLRGAPPKGDLRPRVDKERLAEAKGLAAPPAPSGRVTAFVLGGAPATAVVTTSASLLVSGLVVAGLVYATTGFGPYMVPVALLPGAATGVVLSTLALPQVMVWLGDDAHGKGDVHAARAKGWQLSRWPVLTGAAGALMLTAGTLSSGDGLRNWGLGTAAVSWVAFWVLQTVGVVDGYQKSRRVRPALLPGS